MNDFAIQVENLSKRYRIGLKEQQYDTLAGAGLAWLKSPAANFRRLRKLSRFNEHEPADDIIWALKDVSFRVQPGEVVGIVGRNGAGKSTLLKVLSRITPPTKGRVILNGRVASLLEVGTGFHPEMTGRENVYLNGTILGMSKSEVDRKFDEIVDFAEVEKFIDTPVKRYSSGMRMRLAFAVAAHLEPEILLVDEVLAVGDAAFQKKCLGRMENVARSGRTVLFVTHNMDAILNLCPRSIVIGNGQIVLQGDSEAAVRTYLSAFSSNASATDAHVLFSVNGERPLSQTQIIRIELLDTNGAPKPTVNTWDDLILRVHYEAYEAYRYGTIILDIRDYRQRRLLVFDSGLKMPIEQGQHIVDCVVPQVPLVAGEYYLGAGLAVSNSQWLWRQTNIASFRIHGKDVYQLGRPPNLSRMMFAVPHEWRQPKL